MGSTRVMCAFLNRLALIHNYTQTIRSGIDYSTTTKILKLFFSTPKCNITSVCDKQIFIRLYKRPTNWLMLVHRFVSQKR